MFARIFVAKNPWFMVSQYSLYTPATLSMMLLMTELTGDMAIAALFYRADGAKAKGGADQCSGSEFWSAVGKMLAIGIAASLFAVVPQIVLAKIRQRDFKEFQEENSAEWRRQLRKWRYQDVVVWIIGVSYIMFSLFFVTVFIANVSTKDGLLWMVSAALAIGQSALIVPFAISCVLTFGAFLASRHKQVKHVVRRSITFYPEMEDKEDTVVSEGSLRSTGYCSSAGQESRQPDPKPESRELCSSDATSMEYQPQVSPQRKSQLPEECDSAGSESTCSCASGDANEDLAEEPPLQSLPKCSSQLPEAFKFEPTRSESPSSSGVSNEDLAEEPQPQFLPQYNSQLSETFDSERSVANMDGYSSRFLDAISQLPTAGLEASLGGNFETSGNANEEIAEEFCI
jgi:hypothetical protein